MKTIFGLCERKTKESNIDQTNKEIGQAPASSPDVKSFPLKFNYHYQRCKTQFGYKLITILYSNPGIRHVRQTIQGVAFIRGL